MYNTHHGSIVDDDTVNMTIAAELFGIQISDYSVDGTIFMEYIQMAQF